MNKISLLVIFILINISGCATKSPGLQPLKFERTPYFNISDKLNNLPKPEPLDRKLVKINNSKIIYVDNPNNADYVLLNFENYKKIALLVELAKSYKEIAIQEESLININVDIINSYKEYLELERQKTIEFHELWQEEVSSHRWDNIINKSIGAILLGTNIWTILSK